MKPCNRHKWVFTDQRGVIRCARCGLVLKRIDD